VVGFPEGDAVVMLVPDGASAAPAGLVPVPARRPQTRQRSARRGSGAISYRRSTIRGADTPFHPSYPSRQRGAARSSGGSSLLPVLERPQSPPDPVERVRLAADLAPSLQAAGELVRVPHDGSASVSSPLRRWVQPAHGGAACLAPSSRPSTRSPSSPSLVVHFILPGADHVRAARADRPRAGARAGRLIGREDSLTASSRPGEGWPCAR
jgi:hypothetical protein